MRAEAIERKARVGVEPRPRRQGEWLFMPAADPGPDARLVNGPVKLGDHHVIRGATVVRKDEVTYVRGGEVVHTAGDHQALPLEDVWYEVIQQRSWVRRERRVVD